MNAFFPTILLQPSRLQVMIFFKDILMHLTIVRESAICMAQKNATRFVLRFYMEPTAGLEPAALYLRSRCSTN
jgi:hypothetical protein